VNDAPVNTVPGAQSVAEDTLLPIAGVAVADVDSSTLTTTLNVSSGTLNVTGGAGVTGNGTASVTITGTAAEINTALAGLAYTGSPDFNGADTLTVATSDGTAIDTDTIAITVNAVNDAPALLVAASASFVENALPVLLSPALDITDADSSQLSFAAVEISDGSFAGDGDTPDGRGRDQRQRQRHYVLLVPDAAFAGLQRRELGRELSGAAADRRIPVDQRQSHRLRRQPATDADMGGFGRHIGHDRDDDPRHHRRERRSARNGRCKRRIHRERIGSDDLASRDGERRR
jgi:hypothetical protein